MKTLSCVILILLCFCPSSWSMEGRFTLKDGTVIVGETVEPSLRGVVFRLEDGRLTRRYVWTLFDEATVDLFHADEGMRPYVEVIKPPPVMAEKPVAMPIVVDTVPTPARSGRGVLPGAWILFVIVALASAWAGRVIAEYKRYSRNLCSLVSGIVPLLAPLVLVFLPMKRC